MPSLADRIQSDLVGAMKAHESVVVSTLRLLKSAVKHAEVEKRAPLTDEEFLSVITRQAKMRREAAAEYERASRPELAAQEREELTVLQQYLPAQLDDDAIRKIVQTAIQTTGASNPREMGRVMAAAMPQLRGQADGARVGAIARELLGGDGR